MPRETWAWDVDAPAINIAATNNDVERNFSIALDFVLRSVESVVSKCPPMSYEYSLMVGLGTNLVCAVVNTRRNLDGWAI